MLVCTKHLSTETVIYLLADKTSCYRGETEKGSCKDKIRHNDKMKRYLQEKRWLQELGTLGNEHPLEETTGRWFYDASDNQCSKFSDAGANPDTDGGCVGTGNNFEMKILCEQICKLP